MVKVGNIYEIDLIAYRASLYERNLLFISKITEADSAKFNKIRFPGGRKYR